MKMERYLLLALATAVLLIRGSLLYDYRDLMTTGIY